MFKIAKTENIAIFLAKNAATANKETPVVLKINKNDNKVLEIYSFDPDLCGEFENSNGQIGDIKYLVNYHKVWGNHSDNGCEIFCATTYSDLIKSAKVTSEKPQYKEKIKTDNGYVWVYPNDKYKFRGDTV